MITVRGNVLDAFEKDGPVVILQQVNCQGVMGSGVAKAIRDKYPQVYTQYSWMIENSDPRQPSSQLLGNRQMIEVEKNKFVVNLFAQDFFGRDGRQYTNYEALRQSLMNLKYGLDARCLTDEWRRTWWWRLGSDSTNHRKHHRIQNNSLGFVKYPVNTDHFLVVVR